MLGAETALPLLNPRDRLCFAIHNDLSQLHGQLDDKLQLVHIPVRGRHFTRRRERTFMPTKVMMYVQSHVTNVKKDGRQLKSSSTRTNYYDIISNNLCDIYLLSTQDKPSI